MNVMKQALAASLGVAAFAVLVAPVQATAQSTKDRPAVLTVDNTRSEPVTVYVDRDEFDIRVGTVPAHQKAKLQLPSYLDDGQDVQVFVHPEGGQDLASQDVTVTWGEDIDILVPTNNVGYVPPPAPEKIANPGPGTTTVTVQNPRDVPVTVFVERGEFDARIGTVAPDREVTLKIPEYLTRDESTIQIVVHPERGMDLASQDFDLKPDAHLLVKVPLRS